MSTTESSEVAASASTPPGWYPDPWGQHDRRYWDGHDWTGRTEDAATEQPKGRARALLIVVLGMAAVAMVIGALSFADRREKLALLAVVFVLPLAATNLARLARIGHLRPLPAFASVMTWLVVVAVVAVGGYRGFQGPSTCADRLSAGGTLAGCSFVGRDLTKFDLHDADLTGADLTDADLHGVDLSGANLARATLRNTNLSGARLDGADLRDAVMAGTNLSSAVLVGADLQKSVMDGATLEAAQLDAAQLANAQWHSVHARSASLTGADLTAASIARSDLTGAVLDDANLRGSTIEDTSLVSAMLARADFTDATLTRVGLESTDLVSVKGLTDTALAGAFAVDPLDVATKLSDGGLFLEEWSATLASAAAVCSGTPAPNAGTSPANGSWVVIVNEGSTSLQWPATPPALRYVELVACVGATTTVDLDECGPYFYADGSPAHPITRYRESVTVRLVNPATGAVVAQQTFDGPDPGACPLVESASTYRMGGDLDIATVDAGVTQMVAAAGV